MPRRYRPARRPAEPDPRYNSEMIGRFVNHVMRRGKKSTALRIVYDSFNLIEERMHTNPLEVFEKALNNAMPVLYVKPRRVGGATYQVPVEIPEYLRPSLAMRWLLESARKRSGHSMAEKLAAEIMDAYKGEGATIKKKEDTHKMAESNRAFAHYRW
ncbi:MAG: 30S ribosomal protein S7 [Chloroflexi bacterium]|nr:30S ribosomal protein S7 [Chloroflexota bacterium]